MIADISDDSLVILASFVSAREEGRLRISSKDAHVRLREQCLLPQDLVPFVRFPSLISVLWPVPSWTKGWSSGVRSTARTLALENLQGPWVQADGVSKVVVNGRLVFFYLPPAGFLLSNTGALTGTIEVHIKKSKPKETHI